MPTHRGAFASRVFRDCTCIWHFAPGQDMVRSYSPDCGIPDHRAKAHPPR